MYIYICLQFEELFLHLPVPSYCVNPCTVALSTVAPTNIIISSTVASSTVTPTNIITSCTVASSTVVPTNIIISRTVAPNTVAPTNIITLSIVAPTITEASTSIEARHDSTRNTEWPPTLNYNIHDTPMLSHRPHFRIRI
jgi:hypothetical protein